MDNVAINYSFKKHCYPIIAKFTTKNALKFSHPQAVEVLAFYPSAKEYIKTLDENTRSNILYLDYDRFTSRFLESDTTRVYGDVITKFCNIHNTTYDAIIIDADLEVLKYLYEYNYTIYTLVHYTTDEEENEKLEREYYPYTFRTLDISKDYDLNFLISHLDYVLLVTLEYFSRHHMMTAGPGPYDPELNPTVYCYYNRQDLCGDVLTSLSHVSPQDNKIRYNQTLTRDEDIMGFEENDDSDDDEECFD